MAWAERLVGGPAPLAGHWRRRNAASRVLMGTLRGIDRPCARASAGAALAEIRDMIHRYFTLFMLVLTGACALAQTTITPQSVTCTLNAFGSVPAVGNLIAGIGPATTASTTFPYAPGSGFSDGIGFVSQYGQWQGSITYTFASATSVSRMLLWNAYFNFELDHSTRNAQLTFYNSANQVISSEAVSFPQASASVLTPQVANLAQEVLGVKKVVVTVQSLWGGNEISLRRMAFAGNGITTGVEEEGVSERLLPYPQPALDQLTIPATDARACVVTDLSGKPMAVPVALRRDQVLLDCSMLPNGAYLARMTGPLGQRTQRFVVAR